MEIDIASFGRAALFLGVPFVLLVFYLQWKWAKDCSNFVRVLVAQQSGGGKFMMAPKTGGEVSIKNPHNNTTRTWPINELATIEVLYPGVGFVPAFLQKTIRMAIVSEGDWEPLLNRSRHMTKVASPDIVLVLEAIRDAEGTGDGVREKIENILDGISTSPTREMIASPAVLGNLMQEKISEVVATVAKDVFDPLKDILRKLGKPINPTIAYILMGLTLVMACIAVYFLVAQNSVYAEQINDMAKDMALIKQSLGVR